MPIFVTGASGFVGARLARLLCARGQPVRCLARKSSDLGNLRDLPAEIVYGDLRDLASLRAAIKGCEIVYHVAADYRLWCRNPRDIYASNVEGTRNLLSAAEAERCRRIVYCSSVATIGIPAGGTPGDETTPVTLDQMIGHYKRSKFLAERVAIDAARRGAPVVIVNPSTPVGPGDHKPTETGRIITRFLNGQMPCFLDTGLNLVDVDDVAIGHVLACERGRSGERYILGNSDMMLCDILRTLGEISGLPAPRVRLPFWIVLPMARADQFVEGTLLGRTPSIPLEGVRMARKRMFFSSDKARKELGYSPGPVRAALERAVRWYVENGYVRRPLPSFTPSSGTDIKPSEA